MLFKKKKYFQRDLSNFQWIFSHLVLFHRSNSADVSESKSRRAFSANNRRRRRRRYSSSGRRSRRPACLAATSTRDWSRERSSPRFPALGQRPIRHARKYLTKIRRGMGRCTWCLRVRDAMENTGEWRRLYEEERFRRSNGVSIFLWFTPILLSLFFFSSSSSSSSRSSSFFLRFRLFFSLSSAVMYFFSVWEYLAVAVDEWTETALSSSLRFNLVSRLLSFFSISLSSLLFSRLVAMENRVKDTNRSQDDRACFDDRAKVGKVISHRTNRKR